MSHNNAHSADAAALGFLYQGQYALLLLWRDADDEATVYLEKLDDVQLRSNGDTLLEQLKHSLQAKPPSLTVSNVQVWKTLRAWIDVLPSLDLAHTWFHLVAVADISAGSPLEALLDDQSDRADLLQALDDEATRVGLERRAAAASGKQPPHADRAAACEAFLNLEYDLKAKLLSRARIKRKQPNITEIEEELAAEFTSVLREKRAAVARQLIEWWNGQILDLLTKKRDSGISRFEVVERHMQIVSAIHLDELTSAYANAMVPPSYQPDSMIKRQIELVGGGPDELKMAIREEWRAREERSRWSTENPARYRVLKDYDERLVEEWSDRHTDMRNACHGGSNEVRKGKGFALLKWSHFQAPKDLEPIAPKITSPYYVRGSYQALSIIGRVGWHPYYLQQLGFEK